MKHIALSICIAFTALPIAHAQVSSTTLPAHTRFRVKDLDGGAHAIVAESPFGFDSSHVAYATASADWTLQPVAERRFTTDPLWFLFDAAPAPNGMFVTGTLTNTYRPQLHFINNDGSLAWCTGFDGMNASQTRFSVLVSEGANAVGYSNADGLAGDATYRVETDQAGSSFTLRRISTTDNLTFRLFTACGAGAPSEHLVGGVGITTGVGDIQALLGRFTTTGAAWLKQYEMGSNGLTEELDGIVRLSGGGAACAITLSKDAPASIGAVMRVNDAGDVLWCNTLNFPGGLMLSAITEMGNGDLLVAGSDLTGRGVLLRLDASGTLLWSRKCASCFYNTINAFHRDAANTLYGLGRGTLFTLDESGVGCGFDALIDVTSTPYTPVITTLHPTVDMSPAVTTTAMAMLTRGPVSSATPDCTTTGIMERTADPAVLSARPQPTTGMLYLDPGDPLAANEPVHVFDITGAQVYRGAYGDGLDLQHLRSGVYSVELPIRHLRTLVIKE